MKELKTYYTYLSFFRVYLALHIIKKYVLYLPYAEDLFGKSTFYGAAEDPILALVGITNDHSFLIITLLLSFSLLMLFGIGRNMAVLGVFILLEIVQRLNGYLLNGGDNLLKFIMLYMVFTNSFTKFTLFQSKSIAAPQTVAKQLNDLGVLAIKMHLCLIYFISGIHKINSKVWFHGVATYYTLSLERFSGSTLNKYFVQNGYFVALSTYITVLWELFFPALIWFKRPRLPLLVIGVFVHLGIYFMMMIHDFEMLFIATYGLFITDAEWAMLLDKIKMLQKKYFNFNLNVSHEQSR